MKKHGGSRTFAGIARMMPKTFFQRVEEHEGHQQARFWRVFYQGLARRVVLEGLQPDPHVVAAIRQPHHAYQVPLLRGFYHNTSPRKNNTQNPDPQAISTTKVCGLSDLNLRLFVRQDYGDGSYTDTPFNPDRPEHVAVFMPYIRASVQVGTTHLTLNPKP